MKLYFPDTGYFSLRLTENINGCISEKDYPNLIRLEGPRAAFNVLTPKYCNIPDTLKAVYGGIDLNPGTTRYEWTVFAEDSTPVHYFSDTKNIEWYPDTLQNYHIQLITIGSNGCRDTSFRLNAVEGKPLEIRISKTPNPACPNQIMTLMPNDTGHAKNRMFFDWKIIDRKDDTVLRSDKKFVEFTWPDTARFTLYVIAWNEKGCRDTLYEPEELKFLYPDITLFIKDSFLCRNQEFVLGSTIRDPSSTATRWWMGRNRDTGNVEIFTGGDSTLAQLPKQGRYRFTFYYEDTAFGGCNFELPYPGQLYVSGPNISASIDPDEDCYPLKSNLRARIISDVDLAGEKLKPKFSWRERYVGKSHIDSQALITTATLFKELQLYSFKYTGASGCSDSVERLRAWAGVLAHAEIGGKNFCRGDTFFTTNKSSRTATGYRWISEDPAVRFIPSNTVPNPKIIVSRAGLVPISLVATNREVCYDTFLMTIKIDSVRADFYSPDSITYCAPQIAQLINKSTGNRWNTWQLEGDTGSLESLDRNQLATLIRENNVSGISVKLKIKSWYGCMDSITRPNYLRVLGPTVEYNLGNTMGCETLPVSFVNRSNYFSRVVIDFGDGSVSDSKGEVTHHYNVKDKSKDYQVYYPAFALYDSLGCYVYQKSTDSIIVHKAAEAMFVTDKMHGCVPLTVRFSNRSLFWQNLFWDFNGDGITDSREAGPTWTFEEPGEYRPRLIAQNFNACIDTFQFTEPIVVHPAPVTDFAMSNDSVCYHDTVFFYNKSHSQFPPLMYFWDLGEEYRFNDMFTTRDAKYAYPFPFDKNVFLRVTDSMGCIGTVTKVLHVHDTIPPVNQGMSHVTIMPDNRTIGVYWNRYTDKDFLAYHLYQDSAKYYYIKRYRDNIDTSYLTARGDSIHRQNFCFAIRAEDTCNILSDFGISHCTILTKAERPEGVPFTLRVKWTPYNGWLDLAYYEVYRSVEGSPFERYRTMKPWELEMYDSFLCEKRYCYYVVGVNAKGRRSRSNESCAIPVYYPPYRGVPVELATVELSSNAVINWYTGPDYLRGGMYSIHRHDGKLNRQIGVTTKLEFTDSSARVNEQSYTYYVHYVDHCGAKGPGATHGTTIFLSGVSKGSDAHLSWNPYSYWHAGVDAYRVEKLSADGVFETRAILAPTETGFIDVGAVQPSDDTLVYRVSAIEKSGRMLVSESNYARIVPESRMFVPTAFTPNGDGHNDYFGARTIFVVKHKKFRQLTFELKVFNRWGEMVFFTQNPDEEWDGTYMGKPCPAGVYAYLAKGVGYDGKLHVAEGAVTLVR
jgi:gliding motility-associated-like protein